MNALTMEKQTNHQDNEDIALIEKYAIKGSTSPPVMPLIGLITRVLTVPLLPPEKLRVRVI